MLDSGYALVLLKVGLAPIIIAFVSLAERWFGRGIAGSLLGLPVVSGPLLVCLTFQHGAAFATQAARGSVMGQLALATFALAYAYCAQERRWLLSGSVAIAIYLIVSVTLLKVGLNPAMTLITVFLLLGLALLLFPRPRVEGGRGRKASAREIALRMLTAGSIVFLLASMAQLLGPDVSGLLASLPVYSGVLAVFNHIKSSASAVSMLKGVVVGASGTAAFSGVLMLGLTVVPIAVCFALAVCSAVGVQALLYPNLKRSTT
jgi:hypothetical protein